MKIRNCFVSNSSSASFIIDIQKKKKDFYKGLYHNTYTFEPHTLHGKLKEYEELFKEDTLFTKTREIIVKALSLFEVKEVTTLSFATKVISISEENLVDLFDLYFESRGMGVFEEEDNCTITSTITMYNDFADFGLIFQELIYFLTVSETPFAWKIESDD